MAQTRYLPYGEERWADNGAQPTDFTFTGQRAERGFGLMDYQARYYDPRLGRFISPDSIVPSPGDPQDLNRFSYVASNPLKFTDPAGHRHECGSFIGECSSDTYYAGFSVLDDRPEVQAYLKEAGDPKHFLEPIVMWAVGGMLGGVVGDVVGDLIPGLRPPTMQTPAGERLPYTETPRDAAARTQQETTLQRLQRLANQADTAVPGRGSVAGTKKHTEFARLVEQLGKTDLNTEVSYQHGRVVERGTPGSVRVDVVQGPLDAPTAVYDLKTGSATLTSSRITQIQMHLPGGANVPVIEIHPQ